MTKLAQKRKNNLITVTLLLLFIILMTTLMSCTSKSGHLANQPVEKVVILDMYPDKIPNGKDGTKYKYRVKRIEHGVVSIVYDYNLYEINDTIYKRFN